ncbi:MAG: aldehyde dehydrogenase family protein, partial [Verrucomicrobiota bacterium]|nr:aldehyde dehydrogenase family protein [Verrucomicrobiota bacterium]
MAEFSTTNPATGEKVAAFDLLTSGQIEEKLRRIAPAFAEQRRTSFADRARLMNAVAARLDSDRERYARLITLEMGKPIVAAREEVAKCAGGCRFYAENAERFLAAEEVALDQARGSIRYQPIGAVLAIMPWNFPFWQVFRFAAPALMAGNVALLKHAPNVPQCALAIEQIFGDAGYPAGLFQALLIDDDQTETLIGDGRVRAVTLTGSERAGSIVASTATRAIKKSVLELGGSDPFIVMPSADVTAALEAAVKTRTLNA